MNNQINFAQNNPSDVRILINSNEIDTLIKLGHLLESLPQEEGRLRHQMKEEASDIEGFISEYIDEASHTILCLTEELPKFIKNISFYVGFLFHMLAENSLSELEYVILRGLANRTNKALKQVYLFALEISAPDADLIGQKEIKPIVYSILTEESVVRGDKQSAVYLWYPTRLEIESLIDKLNKLLEDPLMPTTVYSFRKKVILLARRLDKISWGCQCYTKTF